MDKALDFLDPIDTDIPRGGRFLNFVTIHKYLSIFLTLNLHILLKVTALYKFSCNSKYSDRLFSKAFLEVCSFQSVATQSYYKNYPRLRYETIGKANDTKTGAFLILDRSFIRIINQ